MQIKLRDRVYQAVDIDSLADLKLVPMLTVILTDANGDEVDMAAMTPPQQQFHTKTIMRRLAQPASHYQIAYSVCAVVPSIDRALCDYKSFVLPNGSRQEDIVFNLSANDILELFSQLNEAIQARQKVSQAIAQPVSNRPRRKRS